MKTDYTKLNIWKQRLQDNEAAYSKELGKMDKREKLYRGDNRLDPTVEGDKVLTAAHVRNICAEMIESLVSSSIPQPKVTARRKKDEHLAKVIEDKLRNELDRLPFEMLNDMMERTVPIQGGAAFLVEWDNDKRTHYTVGELSVSTEHPKCVIPQAGVYSGIEDMDYVILKIPQTKEYIKARYGISVDDEGEKEMQLRGDGASYAKDMVTQYIAYYRNTKGGIGLYSWVNNTQLEDMDDYQSRRIRVCAKCGAKETDAVEAIDTPTVDGSIPTGETVRNRGVCKYCGSTKWETADADFEEMFEPVMRSDGQTIGAPSMQTAVAEDGTAVTITEPFRIPYYKPNIFPVILCKNVSLYGSFLGDSDIDKLESYQNAINRMETKIMEKLIKGGSYLTMPEDASISTGKDINIIYPESPAAKAMIGVVNVEGSIQQDLVYLNQLYEEAKQVIGVTDSFLGRNDPSAASGKAKEFAAAQSAGRMESRRIMKEAAYAQLFEAMFKFLLAYSDEPRPVVSTDNSGHPEYTEWNKYDFLEQDDAGEWVWNDNFLFSCDSATGIENNRSAMWQEARNNFQMGAYGNPTELDTLVLYWQKLAALHYPGALDTRDFLEKKRQELQMQQQMQAQQQSMAQMRTLRNGMTNDVADGVIAQAQRDAANDAANMRNRGV